MVTVSASETMSRAGMKNRLGSRRSERQSRFARLRFDASGTAMTDDLGSLRQRGEPMRGAQQRGFIGLRHWHLGDHTPTEQDDRTIASERYLGKFRSKQQHGGSRCRQLPDQGVDLALRADIDAASRVEAQQSVEPAGKPARDYHLLLVAAA